MNYGAYHEFLQDIGPLFAKYLKFIAPLGISIIFATDKGFPWSQLSIFIGFQQNGTIADDSQVMTHS